MRPRHPRGSGRLNVLIARQCHAIRRFLSVLGWANRRRSTGFPGSPSANASATPEKPKSQLSRSARITAEAADRPARSRDRQAEDGAEVQLNYIGVLAINVTMPVCEGGARVGGRSPRSPAMKYSTRRCVPAERT